MSYIWRVFFSPPNELTLSSLYDRSDGFYRRQMILKVKEKDPNRVDDRFLMDKLDKEKELIAAWALEGLKRLVNE